MDTSTGIIYPDLQAALDAHVPEKHLVQGTREALEDLQKRLKLNKKYIPHQGKREMERRKRHAK